MLSGGTREGEHPRCLSFSRSLRCGHRRAPFLAPQQLGSVQTEATAMCDRVVVVHCDPQIIDMVHMPNGGTYAPDLMKRPQILLCARCTTPEHPPGKGQMPPHTIYAFYGTRRNRTAAPVMSLTSFERAAARLVEVRTRPAHAAPPVRRRCCNSGMPPCGVRRARGRALWCRCAVRMPPMASDCSWRGCVRRLASARCTPFVRGRTRCREWLP